VISNWVAEEGKNPC